MMAPDRGGGPRGARATTETNGDRASRSGSTSREISPVTTIVLADDHPVVRRGLRMMLDAEEGLEVVAEAGDVDTAVRKVRGYKPNVLLLDLSMPGGSGLEAIPRALEASPHTAIIVLTMQDGPGVAKAALRAGALGFVLKESADSELQHALHAALSGRRYLNPQLGARIASEPETTPSELSDRELEVLRLLALGYTNSEIADQLFLSVRTVETHRSHLAHKIGGASRFELVGYAREHGLFG